MAKLGLKKIIDKLAPKEGVYATGIDSVKVFRISHPMPRRPNVYAPGICVLESGVKKVHLNEAEFQYDKDSYFCSTIPLPVSVEVTRFRKDHHVLGVYIAFDNLVFNELVVEFEANQKSLGSAIDSDNARGIAVFQREPQTDAAILELLQLTQDEQALGLLQKGRLREVFYALLTGKPGPMIRQTLGVGNSIAKSIQFIRKNLSGTITVEDLATHAGMSRAVFHRRFKEATSISPLQFVKILRLNEASQLMAAGRSVSESALMAGYASASQFSREFKRRYGVPPKEWSPATKTR